MLYKVIETPNEVNELITVVRNHDGLFYADIETTGLFWWQDSIILFQLKINDDIYLLDIRELGYTPLARLLEALNSNGNRVVFHNGKFDLKFLLFRAGILLEHVYDTMVAEVILNSGIGKQLYSLQGLTEKYTDVFMEKDSRMDFINLPETAPLTESMLSYSALDVLVLAEITEKQMQLAQQAKLTRVLSLDMDLLPVVARMEFTGIRLNADEWLKLEAIAKEKLAKLSEEIKPYIAEFVTTKKHKNIHNGLELAKALAIPVKGKARSKALEEITDLSLMKGWIIENFNMNSSYQKKAVVNMSGIKIESMNKKIIARHADSKLVGLFLQISEVSKQISQYGSSFLKDINPVTGKIHTEYFTVGTMTGRFSSQRPNLQNVPSHGGYRECFIPSDGYVFISCDYSQQEYRLTGAVSREPKIIDAYRNNSDMHTATAAHFFKKPLDEVTKDERSWGKTRNFEIIYGTTEWGLSKSLKCNLEEAKDILNEYWKGYPALSNFKVLVEERILELGYSCTPLGRRRYSTPKPVFANPNELRRWREAIKREGFNHIIQGGGADIIKIAVVNLHRRNPFGDKFRIILQIHDELLVEAHQSIAEEARAFLEKEMREAEQPFLKEIPAVVESEIKDKWSK